MKNSSITEADLAASEKTQADPVEFDAKAKIAEIRQNRIKQMEEAHGLNEGEVPEDPKSEEELQPEEEPKADLEAEAEDETDSSVIDVLSQFDLDAIDEETAKNLGKWFSESLGENASAFFEGSNSGAGKDIGKLRGKAKAQAEEIENLKAQLKEATSINRPDSGPFSSINTVEDLEAEADRLEKTAKYWERKLYTEMETDYIGDKEVKGVRDESGKFFTVDDILDYKDGLLEKLKAVPSRKQQILDAEKFLSHESESVNKLKNDLFSENEDGAEAFTKAISDPKFGLIKQLFPDYAETLLESLAYAQLGRSSKPKKKTPIILPKKAKNNLSTSSSGELTQTKGKEGRLRAINEMLQSSDKNLNAQKRLALAREKRLLLKNS